MEFPLYNLAAVQAFVFAERDPRQSARYLIVQFEEYLDTNEYVYQYDQAEPITIAGLPFVTDMQVMTLDPLPPVESDTGRILGMLLEKGFPLSAHALVRRFVHFPDEAHRKELLVQYAEAQGDQPVDPHGFLERALASFAIVPQSIGPH